MCLLDVRWWGLISTSGARYVARWYIRESREKDELRFDEPCGLWEWWDLLEDLVGVSPTNPKLEGISIWPYTGPKGLEHLVQRLKYFLGNYSFRVDNLLIPIRYASNNNKSSKVREEWTYSCLSKNAHPHLLVQATRERRVPTLVAFNGFHWLNQL